MSRLSRKSYQKKNAKARVRLLEELKTVKRLPKNLVVNKLNISASTLKTMEQLGDIIIESDSDYRNPIKLEKQKEEKHMKGLKNAA